MPDLSETSASELALMLEYRGVRRVYLQGLSLSSVSSVDLYGVSLSTLVKPNARQSGTASVQFGTGREKMPVPEFMHGTRLRTPNRVPDRDVECRNADADAQLLYLKLQNVVFRTTFIYRSGS